MNGAPVKSQANEYVLPEELESLKNPKMNKVKLFISLLCLIISFVITSCGTKREIKTTAAWANREKLPPEPIKSVFIIAFTDNLEVRAYLEKDLAAAAVKKGLTAYRSVDIIGPVDMKSIAPVKDVFIKKLHDMKCDAILTVALVHATSETKYHQASDMTYSPYAYGSYAGYGGFGAYGAYGGFGGYYGYATSTMTTPGYYTTKSKYFIESKVFDVKTDELLVSIQTKVTNPDKIEKSSVQYTESLMTAIDGLALRKKK